MTRPLVVAFALGLPAVLASSARADTDLSAALVAGVPVGDSSVGLSVPLSGRLVLQTELGASAWHAGLSFQQIAGESRLGSPSSIVDDSRPLASTLTGVHVERRHALDDNGGAHAYVAGEGGAAYVRSAPATGAAEAAWGAFAAVDVGVRARLTTHVGLGVSLGYEWLRTFDRLPTSSDQQSIALLGGSLQLFARF